MQSIVDRLTRMASPAPTRPSRFEKPFAFLSPIDRHLWRCWTGAAKYEVIMYQFGSVPKVAGHRVV